MVQLPVEPQQAGNDLGDNAQEGPDLDNVGGIVSSVSLVADCSTGTF